MVAPRAILLASFAAAASITSASRAAEVSVVQYHHPAIEHYFMTANGTEIAALDAAVPLAYAVPRTWSRTGLRFVVSDAPEAGTVPVCRFYTDRFAEKASHFFTAHAGECDALKASPDWTYEGIAFHAHPAAQDGACADGFAPITRLYNGGRGEAPNHAYVASVQEALRLRSNGYVLEGTAFCVRTSANNAAAKTATLASTTLGFPSVPEVYGGTTSDVSLFSFGSTLSSGPYTKLQAVGLWQVEHSIYFQFNDAWTSSTGWDPLAQGYVLVGGSGFEGGGVFGIAYLFEDAMAPVAPVCSHVLFENDPPFAVPIQPYLWSGCRAGERVRR